MPTPFGLGMLAPRGTGGTVPPQGERGVGTAAAPAVAGLTGQGQRRSMR